ncbi:hydantoinase B/oxoprolinase family protein [Sinorhizobium meliloti]|uniref:hydantoinase B/oxoprolinase family protein n=1 Tax=Rhizobium meliloti TaxID=382 RepID=UPI000FD76CA4|nr:hydantoinase B/oxoprolinase family protein [Sinorhizobium meliloti]RVI71288.1 hydantoinase B/oxoprolinase family protein [Sinorhizobium meliloti]
MSIAVDPITRSVVQHRLTAIVNEMGEAMLRTTYSQILNSGRDFSLAICDTDNRLIAQADHIPVHVGALPWATLAVQQAFAEVRPGDVFLLNDPYHGGSHLPDLTAFVPVFNGEKQLFWTVVRAHQSDIGGATHGGYNPRAQEIYQEGLRIPPIKLYEQGVLRADLLNMIALNVRNSRDFRGDLSAMLGAVRLGEIRLQKLFSDLGCPTVIEAIAQILDASEVQARKTVSTWQDGTYFGEAFIDDDGFGRTNIRIFAKVTKLGDGLEIDLSDSDEQVVSFVNSPFANMQAAAAVAFFFLIDPETPKNSGALRVLSVKARQGTVVWADEGRAVSMCTSHPATEIMQAVMMAMAHACPERVVAGWGKRFRIAIQGHNPRSGRSFIWHLFHARPGGGASSAGDGWHSGGEWTTVGGLKFGSIELTEARYPLHFRSHELEPGTGGMGKHRGGLGTRLDLELLIDRPATANTAGDGTVHAPPGIVGGTPGTPHRYLLRKADGGETILKTKEVGIELNPGDVLEIHSSGGGGWGLASDRPAELIARDRQLGWE